VASAGSISFPVKAPQAKRMIASARPARFGRGEQTLMDLSVRDTWEITPDQVTLTGLDWDANDQVVIALIGFDKKTIGDVFYASAEARGEALVDAWLRRTKPSWTSPSSPRKADAPERARCSLVRRNPAKRLGVQ
jgi:hypothetical protein